jgi:beta-phosphoglucomutase
MGRTVIKAILFDMDGVLIDARDWHYEALNHALGLFGMTIDRDAHLATFDGLPTRRKLQILSASRGLPLALHGFINALKQSYTTEMIYARCKPRFQQSYALSRLKDNGLQIAVCSNSVRQTVNLMMLLAQLEPFIDLQLSNEDIPVPKPAPDMYLEAMRRFGCEPQECLIIEDSEHGIEAARASGGHLLIVSSPADVTYARIMAAVAEANAR